MDWEYKLVTADSLETVGHQEADGWELAAAVSASAFSTSAHHADKGSARSRFRRRIRIAYTALGLFVLLLVCFFSFVGQPRSREELPISTVVEDVAAGKVTRIVAYEESNALTIIYGDSEAGSTVRTSTKEGGSMVQWYLEDIPEERMPTIEVERAPTWGNYLGIAYYCLPNLLLAAILVFIVRRSRDRRLLLIFKRARSIQNA